MAPILKGKHILIGISGGIAAYKIPELIRLLVKAGAEVRCCTTHNALQFVTPLVLETLSNNQVYTDVFAPHNEHQTEHISLPDWADLMVVAPATANIIGKMANGIADDALSTTFLAMHKPVIVAPAMNENMLQHPALQRNLQTLQSFPHLTILKCDEGFLACGTTGKGRMQEPQDILDAVICALTPKTLQGKRILITAGPTQENIDPVRFISNYSSGKMGYALADLCRRKGAEVTLVSGPAPTQSFRGQTIQVNSAEQMYQACMQIFPQTDIAILAAAVADFTPIETSERKIKHQSGDDLSLHLRTTHDIAAELGSRKKQGQYLVGFALETDNEEANAQRKLQKKNLDMIVLNSLQDAGAGFSTDTNRVTLFFPDRTQQTFPLKDKYEVAEDIISAIESNS